MNSLKNLVIIAVLTAVGYGVYVSLSRNNVDCSQTASNGDGWPAAPTADMASAKVAPSRGGPLPLGDSTAKPAVASHPVSEKMAAPVAPPLSVAPKEIPTAVAPATLGTPIPTDRIAAARPSQLPPPVSPAPSSNSVRNLTPPPVALSPASANESLIQAEFAAFMENIRKTLDEGKLAKAHLTLSKFHDNPDIPPEMAKQITTLLDQLAGTVIYSRQHHLEPAYMTQPGDTIESIARKYNVPWQLLSRINGLMPTGTANADTSAKDQPLPAGTELKVLRGPFSAIVHLDRRELTLMLQGYYAGRFPIGVGRDQPKLEGEYAVCNKTLNPSYYGPNGVTIGPNDPKNPLGGAWIGLTDRIGIHGTNDPRTIGRDDSRGTISTTDRNLQDLYGILSLGSRVTILR